METLLYKYDKETMDHALDVAKLCQTKTEKQVALGHDLLEDTDVSFEEILTIAEKQVADAIYILTRKSTETYIEYIYRIAESKNGLAIKVKIADIEDHLSKKETLKKSLKKRYLKAKQILEESGY